jgi:hypothetical protein
MRPCSILLLCACTSMGPALRAIKRNIWADHEVDLRARYTPDQGARHLPRRLGKHTAEMQSQRSDLLHPFLYRARNLIELYLAFVKLACIRLWLGVYEFTA